LEYRRPLWMDSSISPSEDWARWVRDTRRLQVTMTNITTAPTAARKIMTGMLMRDPPTHDRGGLSGKTRKRPLAKRAAPQREHGAAHGNRGGRRDRVRGAQTESHQPGPPHEEEDGEREGADHPASQHADARVRAFRSLREDGEHEEENGKG